MIDNGYSATLRCMCWAALSERGSREVNLGVQVICLEPSVDLNMKL